MNPESGHIIVTGAAGFIGSCIVGYLNEHGHDRLILVDHFGRADKKPNLEGKKFTACIERTDFFEWLAAEKPRVDFFFHIGARTDTAEFDYAVHRQWNLEYSQQVWVYCTAQQIPLIYASSAATYGSGEAGYEDNHDSISRLKPLNSYGISKNVCGSANPSTGRPAAPARRWIPRR